MDTGLEIIHRYFPDLSPEQRDRFAALGPLYREWNERVNLLGHALPARAARRQHSTFATEH